MKILLVEDDSKIAQFIDKGLREEGYVVHWVSDGESAYKEVGFSSWDLILLDINIPKMDGITLCRKLRQEKVHVPILMLTARHTVENRIEGLDSGADDYLIKPFSFSELLARIRALSRRMADRKDSILEHKGLSLNLVTHKVFFENKEISLTSREFALLQFFMRRKGYVLSRTVIAESVWGYDFQSGTNVIDVYVNYLRNKLRKISGFDPVRTVRHRGYVFGDDLS